MECYPAIKEIMYCITRMSTVMFKKSVTKRAEIV